MSLQREPTGGTEPGDHGPGRSRGAPATKFHLPVERGQKLPRPTPLAIATSAHVSSQNSAYHAPPAVGAAPTAVGPPRRSAKPRACPRRVGGGPATPARVPQNSIGVEPPKADQSAVKRLPVGVIQKQSTMSQLPNPYYHPRSPKYRYPSLLQVNSISYVPIREGDLLPFYRPYFHPSWRSRAADSELGTISGSSSCIRCLSAVTVAVRLRSTCAAAGCTWRELARLCVSAPRSPRPWAGGWPSGGCWWRRSACPLRTVWPFSPSSRGPDQPRDGYVCACCCLAYRPARQACMSLCCAS